eukprot:Gb_10081 [translate_table: standard]
MPRYPEYRGVKQQKGVNEDYWSIFIRHPNEKSKIIIGKYQTAEEAARAHDEVAILLFGSRAKLNFPNQNHGHDSQHSLLKKGMREKLIRFLMTNYHEAAFADSVWFSSFPTF